MMTLMHMYRESLVNAVKSLVARPWTLLLPIGYGFAFLVAALLLSPLGLVGSLLMGLVQAALISSMLYFVNEAVGQGRYSLAELQQSFLKYLWPVVNVGFVLFIFFLVVGPMINGMPNGHALNLVITFALFVLLNATPEVIYQRGAYGGIEAIMASVEFVQENWIEWFIPNLFLGAALFVGIPRLSLELALLGVPFAGLLGTFLMPMLLFPAMVFRGQLFKLLALSPRQREMRYQKR